VGQRLISIRREGWPGRSLHPAMRHLLERAQQARPGHPIEPHTTPRNTVVAYAAQRGLKSVCLSVYAEENSVPYAYSQDDAIAHLEIEALEIAQEAGWQLLHEIDRIDRNEDSAGHNVVQP